MPWITERRVALRERVVPYDHRNESSLSISFYLSFFFLTNGFQNSKNDRAKKMSGNNSSSSYEKVVNQVIDGNR